MKKRILAITISVFTLMLFQHCEKDANDSNFVIGLNNRSIRVTTLDPITEIIAPWHSYLSQQVDVDKDGVFDFELCSDHSLSPGGLNYQKSSIKVINASFQISVIGMSDTLHRCIHIDYDTVTFHTYYNNYSDFICSGSGIDTAYPPINYSFPGIYAKGDTLTQTESWINGDLTLAYYNNSHYGFVSPIEAYSIFRGNWNTQNMKYILFKKEHNGTNLYGWLQLSIDNIKEIRLHEYAIQKK